MTDIVERLEHYAKRAMPHYPNDLCSEAKREIERLQAIIASAQPALIDRLKSKADEQTTALDQIMTTAADNLAAPGSDLKMTLEFIRHVAEHALALTSAQRARKVCGYHDGCPPDGPVCHLCKHLQT